MKKIYAVNGSPRKNGNTAQLLQKALEGAASAGAEVKLIQLADLDFSGCRSCFACKKLENHALGCVLKDELAETLKELLQSDGIIMGSPIYFGAETGLYRNFLERLFFPMLRYTNPPSSRAEKRIDFGFIYTMNVPENVMDEYGYRTYLESTNKFPQMIFHSENVYTIYACDTHQFDDYSKYECTLFDAGHKAEMRKTQFVSDLAKAFEMGRKLAE
ncbi:MAG: flavodoxin family protein [Lentisphaerae bacterium]|nr:flavodoxin family protein [Lentisphaerota bacterium]